MSMKKTKHKDGKKSGKEKKHRKPRKADVADRHAL